MPKLYHQDGTWTVPGQQSRHAERHDIPSNPAELADWLNSRSVPASPAGAPETMPESSEPGALETQAQGLATPTQTPIDAQEIQRWIMDDATPAQVEQTFTAIGVRFHEMRKLSIPTPA